MKFQFVVECNVNLATTESMTVADVSATAQDVNDEIKQALLETAKDFDIDAAVTAGR